MTAFLGKAHTQRELADQAERSLAAPMVAAEQAEKAGHAVLSRPSSTAGQPLRVAMAERQEAAGLETALALVPLEPLEAMAPMEQADLAVVVVEAAAAAALEPRVEQVALAELVATEVMAKSFLSGLNRWLDTL